MVTSSHASVDSGLKQGRQNMAGGKVVLGDKHTHPLADSPRLGCRDESLHSANASVCVPIELHFRTLRFELHVILTCPKILLFFCYFFSTI